MNAPNANPGPNPFLTKLKALLEREQKENDAIRATLPDASEEAMRAQHKHNTRPSDEIAGITKRKK
jgi:hypothetical protein